MKMRIERFDREQKELNIVAGCIILGVSADL